MEMLKAIGYSQNNTLFYNETNGKKYVCIYIHKNEKIKICKIGTKLPKHTLEEISLLKELIQ